MDVPRKKLVDLGNKLYVNINCLKPENYGPVKRLVLERMRLQNEYSLKSEGCKYKTIYGISEQRISEMKKEMNEHTQEYQVKGAALAQLMENDAEAKSEEELRAELSAEMNRAHRQLEYQNIMDPNDF